MRLLKGVVMRRMPIGALTLAVSAMTFAGCATTERPEPAAAPPASVAPPSPNEAVADVRLGHGRNRTASETAGDWATYADHVLVVAVVGESRIEPSAKEKQRGEGMIGRTVSLRVDKVLWSAPDAPQPAPTGVSLSAAGWVFNSESGTEKSAKFGLHESSRLETGHTYVKALEWIDDPCSDDAKKGSWEGLGSGDTIPFDKGVLGVGEFEGQLLTLAQANAKWKLDATGPADLRRQTAGSSVATLTGALKSAKSRPEADTGPRECNPTDS
jgi:hypothetical protein